jgi:hypothetical protein
MSQEGNDLDALTEQAELAIAEGDIQKLIALYQRMEQLGEAPHSADSDFVRPLRPNFIFGQAWAGANQPSHGTLQA